MRGVVLSLFVLLTLSGHAQGIGGCVDSPENPTVILGLIAAGGITAVSARERIVSLLRGRKQWRG